jgi:hypothetical protein
MDDPEPPLAPVIPPETEPTDQVKLLGILAFNEIFVLVPLQIVEAFGVVTTGFGFTVTAIEYGSPTQDPVVATVVISYSIVPAVVLLGFIRI